MSNLKENLHGKSPEFRFKALLPELAKIQYGLSSEGLYTLVGGGVGLDLLVAKYLPGTQFIKHSDVDLYIPINLRGKILDWMSNNGFQVDLLSFINAVNAVVYGNEVIYDLFSINGIPNNPRVPDASYAGILVECHNPLNYYTDAAEAIINIESDTVLYGRYKFSVMDAISQLSVFKTFSLLEGTRRRDVEILTKLVE